VNITEVDHANFIDSRFDGELPEGIQNNGKQDQKKVSQHLSLLVLRVRFRSMLIRSGRRTPYGASGSCARDYRRFHDSITALYSFALQVERDNC
jgi:hypothetical protein